MKLLVKFNLVFLLLFALGLWACGYVSWEMLQRNAREETAAHAQLLMANAIAVRDYTNTQIKPLLDTQMKYEFLPQSVPAFSAIEVLEGLHKAYPEYAYREAMLNPTNPRDRAVDWEADIIQHFRNGQDRELFGVRDTPSGPVLYFARPLTITDPGCLVCHSTPEAAPRTMVDKYGPGNGFGWNLNETVGAQLVSVPTEVPQARARKTFSAFMEALAGVLLSIGLALNLLLWWMFIRPVTRISAMADRISLGELDVPGVRVGSRDELHVLAESVERLRKSMVAAMQMLEG